MKLSKCKIGMIVNKTNDCSRVGHIIELGINCYGETLLNVRWNDGETSEIHPNNIEKYKEV